MMKNLEDHLNASQLKTNAYNQIAESIHRSQTTLRQLSESPSKFDQRITSADRLS